MRLPIALVALTFASSSPAKLPIDLYAQLRATPGNLAMSPSSVRTVLAVARLGAKSSTKTELDALLGANVTPAGTTTLFFTPDIHPAPEFLAAASSQFHASVLDAASAHATSALGNDVKRGAVIENDVAFHGSWKSKFNEQLTNHELFYVDPKTSERVPMMHLDETDLDAAHTKDADVVALPYEDGSRFVIVVPTNRNGLNNVEKKIETLLSTKLHAQPVRIAMPRFHVESKESLVAPLTALGVKNAWCTPKAHPDFTAMGTSSNGEPICVDDVIHDATIDVDEKGTTAEAHTIVHMAAKEGEREDVLDVVAAHPFFFAIEDAHGDVSFMGRLVDPGGEKELAPSSTKRTKD